VLPEDLEGYGVAVRRWRPEEAELLHRAVVESVEHLRPWMGWIAAEPQTVEERRTMLEQWEREWRAGGDIGYGIRLPDGTVCGGCGLHHRRGPNTLEIGYWIHPAFLRRGLATAAARLLTDAAFTVPCVRHVEIHHDRANVASRGVPRSLGYAFVGERPDEVAAPAEVGVDCCWRMSREDWARSPAAAARS
jgi:RimJ/RimL family protein N-acetyltransferase